MPTAAVRYVALGSSFAAGPGIRPAARDRPSRAHQSARNYPHLVAERCGYDLLDVTSSGATIKDVLQTSQFAQPAQITAITSDTDLVTVTIGGNDMGYIPSLIAACLPTWVPHLPLLGDRLGRATASAQAEDRRSVVSEGISALLAAVRERAPRAQIVCVDYLTVLPPAFREDLPFREPDYLRLAALAADLNAAIADAAAVPDVELVRASEHSTQHHAWSEDPWTSGWTPPWTRGGAAFHPTSSGMAAVAELIASRAKGAQPG